MSAQNPVTELADLIDLIAQKHGKRGWHKDIPFTPTDAAQWWIKLQEKPYREEGAIHNKDTGFVYFPYIERLKRRFSLFVREDMELQEMIIAAREDKIYWRGEDYDRFMSVIGETMKMREIGVERYRSEIKKRVYG